VSGLKLSICIPTYNRSLFLEEAIVSIVEQITSDIVTLVELCISDNASTDNTEEMVRKWQAEVPFSLIYHRNEENLGADLNYLKVIELANGDYCWYLGSDDRIKFGAIAKILKELKGHCDIYLCNRTECDIDMRPVNDRHWLADDIKSMTYNLSCRDELLDYFDNSMSLGAVFSYLSSIIFIRVKWDRVKYVNEFTGSCYAHVFMLFSFLPFGLKLKYISDSYVYCRTGNDFFGQEGGVRRLMIDIDGYSAIARHFFSHDRELLQKLLSIKLHEIDNKTIAIVKFKACPADWGKFNDFFMMSGGNKLRIVIIEWLVTFLRPLIGCVKKCDLSLG